MGTKKRKLTIADVAKELGLSKTTISRAISGKGRIGEETRTRVLRYIRENEYSPSAVAKGLSQSKTYNIGILLPLNVELSDLPFFQNCLIGACEMASSREYDILVSAITQNDISQLVRVVGNSKVDGIMITRTLKGDVVSRYLLEKDVPFIAIGASEDVRVVQIDNDHQKACKELTSLLLLQGNRRVALIGGPQSHMVTLSRLAGYRDALELHGVAMDPQLVFLDVVNHSLLEQCLAQAMQRHADCIVFMDDLLCSQALTQLHREGVRIPADLRVASFYNSTLLDNAVPSITSLTFDAHQMGMEACRLLIDRIEGKEIPQKTLLGYSIVLKDSTAAWGSPTSSC